MAERITTATNASELIAILRKQGITNPSVLAALNDVPRDRFVPQPLHDQAWDNIALPIAEGQTISQPFVVALMTQALRPRASDKVLEIGTGSGYQTAVLARIVREVVSIERCEPLARSASALLSELAIDNARVFIGDGTLGFEAEAPFDGIIVTAGAPDVPPRLMEQLRPDGGRLVVPVGEIGDQQLIAIERHGNRYLREELGPVRFVPLIGEGGWSSGIDFPDNV
jgi:protein-L-isoaspartate(D-aspartate) O-methyltransferase